MAVLEGYEDLGDLQDDDFVSMDDDVEAPEVDTNLQDASVVDGGETNAEEDTEADDPWAWVKDKNPEHVRNSWEKFTQNQQELAAERARLQPYEELYGELTSNQALQEHIRAFYENGGQPATQVPQGFDPKVVEIENELRILQTERQVEKDWAELSDAIQKNGYPEAKKDDVIQYMIDNGIPKMDAAYRAMTYDTVRTKAEESTLNNIKKNKTAALPRPTGRGDSAGDKKPSTIEELVNQPWEEQKENWASLFGG